MLKLLFEAPGLPAFDLPGPLAAAYDGSIGLAPGCRYANFVASVDGVVDGAAISPGRISLASRADRFVMGLLRACADVVVIGAGTLRAESGHRWTPQHVYPAGADAFAELRRRLGLPPDPALAVVTASGRLDFHRSLAPGSLVLTTPAGAAAASASVPAGVEVIVAGEAEHVAPQSVVGVLAERGFNRLLSEGGPRLFSDFLAAGVLDELFLTLSPAMFGDGPPAVGLTGPLPLSDAPIARAELLSVRQDGSHLFLRYSLSRPPSGDDF